MSVDPALHEVAARMACDAMGELSKAHFLANRQQFDYAFAEPDCDKAFGFADRGMEFLLQQGFGVAKKQYMVKTDVYGRGPWVAQYPAQAVAQPTYYDKWTRARDQPMCGDAAKKAAYADFMENCCGCKP